MLKMNGLRAGKGAAAAGAHAAGARIVLSAGGNLNVVAWEGANSANVPVRCRGLAATAARRVRRYSTEIYTVQCRFEMAGVIAASDLIRNGRSWGGKPLDMGPLAGFQ